MLFPAAQFKRNHEKKKTKKKHINFLLKQLWGFTKNPMFRGREKPIHGDRNYLKRGGLAQFANLMGEVWDLVKKRIMVSLRGEELIPQWHYVKFCLGCDLTYVNCFLV